MATAVSELPNVMATAEYEHLEKQIEMLSEHLTDDLQNYLDNIGTTGRFATIKKLDKSVDPQVRLTGTDDVPGDEISIPLGSIDALKLIQAAQLAPSGVGEETVVDSSVGKYVIPGLSVLSYQIHKPRGKLVATCLSRTR
jgi:hypothetical protein